MGVYIPGMEMPKNCDKCPFLDYEEGFCFASGVKHESGWYESTLCPGSIKDGRHYDCPLIEIPPHGRLIDADAIRADIDEKRPGRCYDDAWTLTVIDAAPTIIPAEEGET